MQLARLPRALMSTLILFVVLLGLRHPPGAATPPVEGPIVGGVGPIFAPDTPPDVVRTFYEALAASPDYNLITHWDPATTASNSGGRGQGEAVILTWSIVPDGTPMTGLVIIPACTSNLISTFDATYGPGVWQDKIQEIFESEWAGLSGNVYIREENDDGAAWPGAPGELGVRGDIRIGGCEIDGNSGILAYNFFSNNGDMKLDTADNFFSPAVLNTGFYNVVAHEHGHGAGVMHVCPVNETKLMEPFVTFSFVGMQHDDIRAAQRHYGDAYETESDSGQFTRTDNDSAANASDLGTATFGTPITIETVSVDDAGDEDYFHIALPGDALLESLTLSPVGFEYEDGDQSLLTGQRQPGPIINSQTIHNLDVQLLAGDGTTVLATADSQPAGSDETLSDIPLGTGEAYVRVYPASTVGDVQLYELTLVINEGGAGPTPTPTSGPTAIQLGAVSSRTGRTLPWTMVGLLVLGTFVAAGCRARRRS